MDYDISRNTTEINLLLFYLQLKFDDNRNVTVTDCIEENQSNQDDCREIINSEDNCANMVF